MRRLPSIAAFLLLLASLPGWAQMRAGGGRGSFASHSGGGHVFGGIPSRGSFSGPRFQSRGFDHGRSFGQPDFFRGDRFRNRRSHNFGFGNCFGCGRWGGWPSWYAGYYDPYWWWDSSSSYDEGSEREIRLANEMNTQGLDQQWRMREWRDEDSYDHPATPPRPGLQEREDPPASSTVLVFRDRHQEEIQNYAIVGQTLWTFAPRHTKKIPLADLDLPATSTANDQRGVDFRVPVSGESQ